MTQRLDEIAARLEAQYTSTTSINALADVRWLVARIREASELHQRTEGDPDGLLGDNPWPRCTCGHQWPCPTLRALRGENE